MKTIFDLLKNVKTLAIVCLQFGDTGKGKFVDVFADWADIIVRGTGGDNAGHTVCLNNEEHVFHILPSSILHDKQGKINIIGSGTAVYPKTLVDEIMLLIGKGYSRDNLRLSLNAKLILPWHILLDRLKDANLQDGKIGTTGKGIGPVYTDHVNRIGLTMNDLLNCDMFVRKLKKNLAEKIDLIKKHDPEIIKQIMFNEHLESGLYYNGDKIFDLDSIITQYWHYQNMLRHLISDTDDFVKKQVGKKNILLEGAQGLLLSLDYGTYPYVTSSDCSAAGLAKGAGLTTKDLDMVLGIVKTSYMTRVGNGPLPTELGGLTSASWCATPGVNKSSEAILIHSVNDSDEFKQGIAIRQTGNEYGATTGRPRRVGWLDLPLLRYAIKHGTNDLILTKLDILNDCEVIKLCYQYEYTGPNYYYGSRVLESGDFLTEAIPTAEVLYHCEPQYIEFPGWQCSLEDCREYSGLPTKLKNILEFIKKSTRGKIKIISIGPKREDTIIV